MIPHVVSICISLVINDAELFFILSYCHLHALFGEVSAQVLFNFFF